MAKKKPKTRSWAGGGAAPDDGWSGRMPLWRKQCEQLSPVQIEAMECVACNSLLVPEFVESLPRLGDLELERGAHGIVLFLYDSWFVTYGQFLGMEVSEVPDPEELILYDLDDGYRRHRPKIMHGVNVNLGEYGDVRSGRLLALGEFGSAGAARVSDSSYALVVPTVAPYSFAEEFGGEEGIDGWEWSFVEREIPLAETAWKNDPKDLLGKPIRNARGANSQSRSLFGKHWW